MHIAQAKQMVGKVRVLQNIRRKTSTSTREYHLYVCKISMPRGLVSPRNDACRHAYCIRTHKRACDARERMLAGRSDTNFALLWTAALHFGAQPASKLWACIYAAHFGDVKLVWPLNSNSPEWRRIRWPWWTRAQTRGRRTPGSPRNRTRTRTTPLRQEANCHLTHNDPLIKKH